MELYQHYCYLVIMLEFVFIYLMRYSLQATSCYIATGTNLRAHRLPKTYNNNNIKPSGAMLYVWAIGHVLYMYSSQYTSIILHTIIMAVPR